MVTTVPMSSDTRKVEQNNDNKKKNMMMEKHVTNVVEGDYHSAHLATASQEAVAPSGQTTTPFLHMFKYSELRSATRNFHPAMILGEGSCGKVYKGWVDSVTYAPQKEGVGRAVAIKKWKSYSQGLKEWQAEVNFLEKLSHPNLVKLLGYCQENEELLLVHEFMQKGSLENHLFKKVGKPLPWHTRISIALGVAQGIAFLHTTDNNVIFRDVKPSHILLDQDFNAKISDFGLARVARVNGESHISTQVMGTYGYAAPEYIATGHLYVKNDVYGFGMVMLEMITGLRALDTKQTPAKQNLVEWARPFLSYKNGFHRIIDPRLDNVYPSKGASKTATLILTCLDPDPKNRPSMEKIVSILQVISAIK